MQHTVHFNQCKRGRRCKSLRERARERWRGMAETRRKREPGGEVRGKIILEHRILVWCHKVSIQMLIPFTVMDQLFFQLRFEHAEQFNICKRWVALFVICSTPGRCHSKSWHRLLPLCRWHASLHLIQIFWSRPGKGQDRSVYSRHWSLMSRNMLKLNRAKTELVILNARIVPHHLLLRLCLWWNYRVLCHRQKQRGNIWLSDVHGAASQCCL